MHHLSQNANDVHRVLNKRNAASHHRLIRKVNRAAALVPGVSSRWANISPFHHLLTPDEDSLWDCAVGMLVPLTPGLSHIRPTRQKPCTTGADTWAKCTPSASSMCSLLSLHAGLRPGSHAYLQTKAPVYSGAQQIQKVGNRG